MSLLGDHRKDAYQQRIVRSFSALEDEFRAPFEDSDTADEEVNRIWQNHRGAVNQSSYVLGAFRREFADVHGVEDAPPELVQRAIDCAVFIIRSITGLM